MIGALSFLNPSNFHFRGTRLDDVDWERVWWVRDSWGTRDDECWSFACLSIDVDMPVRWELSLADELRWFDVGLPTSELPPYSSYLSWTNFSRCEKIFSWQIHRIRLSDGKWIRWEDDQHSLRDFSRRFWRSSLVSYDELKWCVNGMVIEIVPSTLLSFGHSNSIKCDEDNSWSSLFSPSPRPTSNRQTDNRRRSSTRLTRDFLTSETTNELLMQRKETNARRTAEVVSSRFDVKRRWMFTGISWRVICRSWIEEILVNERDKHNWRYWCALLVVVRMDRGEQLRQLEHSTIVTSEIQRRKVDHVLRSGLECEEEDPSVVLKTCQRFISVFLSMFLITASNEKHSLCFLKRPRGIFACPWWRRRRKTR